MQAYRHVNRGVAGCIARDKDRRDQTRLMTVHGMCQMYSDLVIHRHYPRVYQVYGVYEVYRDLVPFPSQGFSEWLRR
jgi:hypothetical protein